VAGSSRAASSTASRRSFSGGPRGTEVGPDLTTWEFWWEWNRDDLLARSRTARTRSEQDADDGGSTEDAAPRRGARAIRPTRAEIVHEVVPTLLRTLQVAQWRPGERDLVRACLMALARIDAAPDHISLLPVLAAHLRSDDVLVRATAALALGIAAIPGDEARDLLIALALDSATGQASCGGPVDERTRAFALYGLGLVGRRSQQLASKRLVFATLRTMLESDPLPPPNLQVAALQACGQLHRKRRGVRRRHYGQATVWGEGKCAGAHQALQKDTAGVWARLRF
jgi:hypothetical protein